MFCNIKQNDKLETKLISKQCNAMHWGKLFQIQKWRLESTNTVPFLKNRHRAWHLQILPMQLASVTGGWARGLWRCLHWLAGLGIPLQTHPGLFCAARFWSPATSMCCWGPRQLSHLPSDCSALCTLSLGSLQPKPSVRQHLQREYTADLNGKCKFLVVQLFLENHV